MSEQNKPSSDGAFSSLWFTLLTALVFLSGFVLLVHYGLEQKWFDATVAYACLGGIGIALLLVSELSLVKQLVLQKSLWILGFAFVWTAVWGLPGALAFSQGSVPLLLALATLSLLGLLRSWMRSDHVQAFFCLVFGLFSTFLHTETMWLSMLVGAVFIVVFGLYWLQYTKPYMIFGIYIVYMLGLFSSLAIADSMVLWGMADLVVCSVTIFACLLVPMERTKALMRETTVFGSAALGLFVVLIARMDHVIPTDLGLFPAAFWVLAGAGLVLSILYLVRRHSLGYVVLGVSMFFLFMATEEVWHHHGVIVLLIVLSFASGTLVLFKPVRGVRLSAYTIFLATAATLVLWLADSVPEVHAVYALVLGVALMAQYVLLRQPFLRLKEAERTFMRIMGWLVPLLLAALIVDELDGLVRTAALCIFGLSVLSVWRFVPKLEASWKKELGLQGLLVFGASLAFFFIDDMKDVPESLARIIAVFSIGLILIALAVYFRSRRKSRGTF